MHRKQEGLHCYVITLEATKVLVIFCVPQKLC